MDFKKMVLKVPARIGETIYKPPITEKRKQQIAFLIDGSQWCPTCKEELAKISDEEFKAVVK